MSNWKDRATKVDKSSAKSWKDRAVSVSDDSSQDSDVLQTLGDGARGAVQGATLGFGDEIYGGAAAAKDLLTGQTDVAHLGDSYRSSRDEARANNKIAEERSPVASAVGNLAGGLGTALIPGGQASAAANTAKSAGTIAKLLASIKATEAAGGLAGAALTGAKIGTAAGLGTSDADLTKGDVGGAAVDTALGGAGGAVAGSLLHGGIQAAKGVKNTAGSALDFLKDTSIGERIQKSFGHGLDGKNFLTKSAVDDAEQGIIDSAKKVGVGVKEANQTAGKEIGAAKKNLSDSGAQYDIEEQVKKIQAVIKKLENSDDPSAQDDVKFLNNYMENLIKGREKEVSVQHSKWSPSKQVEAAPSAEEKLTLELAKENANRAALGQSPLTPSFTRSEDEAGNKLLTMLRTGEEQVGAAERALPVKDESGNVISNLLDQGNAEDNFLSTAKAKTVLDTPSQAAQTIPGQQGPIVNTTTTVRQGGTNVNATPYDKAQEVLGTLNDFSGITGSAPRLKTTEAINGVKQAAGEISSKVKADPILSAASAKSKATFDAAETLGLDLANDFQRVGSNLELTTAAKQKLQNLIRREARGGETASGSNAAQKLGDAIEHLKKADPQMAQALEKEISSNSEVYNLVQQGQGFNPFNQSTWSKTLPIQAANQAGLLVSKLSNATPQSLKFVAQKVMNKGPVGMKLASQLADAMQKDQVGRNAALFALQQNPEYRKLLNTRDDE